MDGQAQSVSPVRIFESAGLAAFLAAERASIAFTTYQAGKILFVGVNEAGRISIFERSFPRSMGLSAAGGRLWLSSLWQLWQFENFLDPGQWHEGYDALFVPVAAHTTGEIDIHDIAEAPDGQPVFVATRMNCLATLAEGAGSFTALWSPPFIDALVPEDRCHLNGAAFDRGVARFVTCVAATNTPRGWADRRRTGGAVLEVPSGEVVASGLSMPHSPRLHGGRLWLIESGSGTFGWVDRATGRFEPVCALPGFGRGLGFLGGYAVIGVSGPRADRTFEGLALNERLAAEGQAPQCGLVVVCLETGEIRHRLAIEGTVRELYDVAVLPGLARPMALGLKGEAIRYALRPVDRRGEAAE